MGVVYWRTNDSPKACVELWHPRLFPAALQSQTLTHANGIEYYFTFKSSGFEILWPGHFSNINLTYENLSLQTTILASLFNLSTSGTHGAGKYSKIFPENKFTVINSLRYFLPSDH